MVRDMNVCCSSDAYLVCRPVCTLHAAYTHFYVRCACVRTRCILPFAFLPQLPYAYATAYVWRTPYVRTFVFAMPFLYALYAYVARPTLCAAAHLLPHFRVKTLRTHTHARTACTACLTCLPLLRTDLDGRTEGPFFSTRTFSIPLFALFGVIYMVFAFGHSNVVLTCCIPHCYYRARFGISFPIIDGR